MVPKCEGKLKELPVKEGNIIQDNNFLQCSRTHKEKVFEMLKTQRGIEFRGGLEAELIDDHFIENVRGLHLKRLWLACDSEDTVPEFKKAMEKLRKIFPRDKVSCYCLSYGRNMEKDEARALMIYEEGAMPFVQLYQRPSDTRTKYSKEWNDFQRNWSRPAITKRHANKLLGYKP